jgi:predicted dithiol-disulfide oxidoreductase (DUF899 family)
MASLHEIRFPGESAAYRAARDQLLESEIALRRQMERVAEQRRALPLGGEVQDYLFDEGDGRKVKLSELFREGSDTLALYSYMYGPEMARPCPLCSSMLDGLDGQAPHVTQRMALAVVAKSPIERIRAFARERGWRRLRLLSSAGTTYNRDYHGESPDGKQFPSMNVFVRRGGKIHHFYNTEMFFAPPEPGQDPRHIDLLWPLWQVIDLTPEGRSPEWRPPLDSPR